MALRTAVGVLRKGFNFSRAQRRWQHRDIGVIGAPFNLGQTHGGVSRAPFHLRDAGLLKQLELMGYRVTDYGDLTFERLPDDPPCFNIKLPRSIGLATQKISDSVSDILRDNKVCLTLGGDHSLSLGTVYGHSRVHSNMALVWVDAHADINPPLSSVSGNLHGMPLSFLAHELSEYIPKVEGLEWLAPCIDANNIAYIGLRDLDPAERFIIEKYGITCFTMHEVDRYGVDHVMERTLDAINPKLDKSLHLSYDIDSLDPSISPSTGTPVPGGLTIREGMYIAEELASTGKLEAIDLVEVNPELGTKKEQDLTLFAACEIIAACFGKRRQGNVPKDFELQKPNV